MTIQQLLDRLRSPEPADRMMPFWFWNDSLDDVEIERQIADFEAHGLGGFVIHPRQGLPREIGYLTERWLQHCRAACRSAAARGMKVILYDEGVYPSGASGGRVTRGRPDLQSRGLQRVVHRFSGGERRYWRGCAGEWMADRLVAVALTPLVDGVPGYPASRPLEANERGLVRLDPGPGEWQVEAYLDVLSGGTIRGVHEGEDDVDADAPPAADLLNPDAAARFLATTHDVYAEALGEWLGDTVVAIFVDEPGLMGRGARRRGLQPWTGGLETVHERLHGEALLPRLAALFDAAHPEHEALTERFQATLAARMNETFYGPIARWCADHGIALVGHPAESQDLAGLATFQWPGQDMVWRYVEPDSPTALEGHHAVAARVASSAKRLWSRERAACEIAGAYGWHLTFDELKWLTDWHLARGVDLLIGHAHYYSVRGARGYERPPCLGENNTWWPWFRPLADYAARLCALLRAGELERPVAVACDSTEVPWQPGAVLQPKQIDFDYVPRDDLAALRGYAEVVSDTPLEGVATIAAADATARVLAVDPPLPDLRAWRMRVGELTVVCLINEGEQPLAATATLAPAGRLEQWDPLAADLDPRPWPARRVAGGIEAPLRLERRQALLWVIDPGAEPDGSAAAPDEGWQAAQTLEEWEWRPPGATDWRPATLGDWTVHPELELFSGTIAYRTRLELPHEGPWLLDLGAVAELAAVRLNGEPVGQRGWAPYRVRLTRARAGANELTVEVANSAANAFTGALRPSGLLGPVTVLALTPR